MRRTHPRSLAVIGLVVGAALLPGFADEKDGKLNGKTVAEWVVKPAGQGLPLADRCGPACQQ